MAVIRVKLGQHFSSCPVWWRNFVNSVHPGDLDDAIILVNDALIPYSAYTIERLDSWYLVFHEEKYYTFFVLKWS